MLPVFRMGSSTIDGSSLGWRSGMVEVEIVTATLSVFGGRLGKSRGVEVRV